MNARTLASLILRDMGDETLPPANFYNPAYVNDGVGGYYVPIPGSEVRTDHAPPLPMIEAIISWAFVNAAQTDGMGGYREHATGGGYAVNVRKDSRIGVRKVGRYWYFDASTITYDRTTAENLAGQRHLPGFWDAYAGRFVHAEEYGDYRAFAEPTRATRFTSLMGVPLDEKETQDRDHGDRFPKSSPLSDKGFSAGVDAFGNYYGPKGDVGR